MEDLLKFLKDTQTPFLYHEDINKAFCKDNKNLTKEEVLVRYETNEFTISDLIIVQALAKIVFGTKEMILKVLENLSKEYPDKPILVDSKALKGRLSKLVKSAVMKRFTFHLQSDKRTHSYYCVSPHGYNYIKRIFRFKDKYDEYIAVTPIDEVMKCLAATSVAQEFTTKSSFIDFQIGKNFYIKEKGLFTLYAEVETLVGGEKKHTLIEPLYFKYDKNRISEKELQESLIERMEVISTYFSKRMETNMPTIFFVCENIGGIRRAMALGAEYLASYKNYIYYTTDAVVHNVGIEKSLMRIEEIDKGMPVNFTNNISKPFI